MILDITYNASRSVIFASVPLTPVEDPSSAVIFVSSDIKARGVRLPVIKEFHLEPRHSQNPTPKGKQHFPPPPPTSPSFKQPFCLLPIYEFVCLSPPLLLQLQSSYVLFFPFLFPVLPSSLPYLRPAFSTFFCLLRHFILPDFSLVIPLVLSTYYLTWLSLLCN